jgi:hypothetical protein
MKNATCRKKRSSRSCCEWVVGERGWTQVEGLDRDGNRREITRLGNRAGRRMFSPTVIATSVPALMETDI